MTKLTRDDKRTIAVLAVAFVIWLSVVSGIIYVAAHFILKYW